MRTPRIVTARVTGMAASVKVSDIGMAPASRSTPAGSGTSVPRPLAGARMTSRAARNISASAAWPIRPQRPSRNRPVGKIRSSTATVIGRNAPNRLSSQRAALTPASASSARTP